MNEKPSIEKDASVEDNCHGASKQRLLSCIRVFCVCVCVSVERER